MSKYVGKIITNQAPAGYSVFFDGTGDYLVTTTNIGALGTGNFTYECWAYPTSSTSFRYLFSIGGDTNFTFALDSGNYRPYFYANATILVSSASVALNANQWNHVALVRNSGTVTIYVNGVSGGSAAFSTSVSAGLGYVGAQSTGSYGFPGYLSNCRLTNTAVYTAAGFALPTQLLNISGTQLLTCNSPAIVDQSSNAFAITTNGNAAVSTFTPFRAYVPYNPALGASTPGVWTLDEAMQAAATRQWNMYDPYFQNTTLLLHGNGTNAAQNNTFLDSSTNNFTITRNGNTTQGSFSPFSQTGWSGFFNGSSTISLPSDAAFNLSSGTWTFEAFLYLTSAPSKSCRAFMIGTNNNLNSYILFAINTDLTFGCGVPFSGTGVGSGTTTLPLNQWNHVAISMSSSTGSMYLNGVRVGNQAGCTMMNNVSAAMTIGQDSSEVTVNAIYAGYMASARIVKGVALYSGLTCAVPTSPLTAVSGTSFLTFTQNRFVDLGSSLTMTLNGTPSVQAFSPFYPTAAYTPATIGGSGYFDGTGDYLSVANNAAFQFGSGDWTFETWAYCTDFSTARVLYVLGYGYTNTDRSLVIYIGTSGDFRIAQSPDGSTNYDESLGLTLSANCWNHLVVSRSGATVKGFLNGTGGTGLTARNLFASTKPIYIGAQEPSFPSPYVGYMSSVRVLKGTGYTSVTVPTAPLTAITNTQLLLNFTNAGIVDSTAKNVLETVGNAQISTTQSKFGGSSMYFDGTGDWALIPASANLEFGTGNFTIEMWVYPTTTGSVLHIFGQADAINTAATQSIVMYKNGTEKLVCYAVSGSTQYTCTSSGNLTQNAWTHIAFVRNGSTLTQYINGTADGTATISTNSVNARTTPFAVGQIGQLTMTSFNGYIDDLRITKGFARYTGNFTPQTSQWQDQ